MNYYIAEAQDTLPFVTFSQVAGSLSELEEKGLADSPLIVSEEQLTDSNHPDYISFEYGICHVRIFNGELVPALPGDIAAAQANLSKALNVQKTRAVGVKMETRTFSFGGNAYPLNNAAIAVYSAAIKKGADITLIATAGPTLIASGDLPSFETAMIDAIIAVNNEGLSS